MKLVRPSPMMDRTALAHSRQRLAIEEDVLDQLTQLFVQRGAPGCVRSDNEAEFTAKAVRRWLWRVGGKALQADWLRGRHYRMIDYNNNVLAEGTLANPRLTIPDDLPVYITEISRR